MLLFMAVAALNLRKRTVISVLATVAALLSKESGVLTAPFLLGYDWVCRGREGGSPNWKTHLPFVTISSVYVVLRATVLNFQNLFNFYNSSNILTEHWSYRLYTYLSTLPKALQLLVWPSDLHHERSWMVYPEFSSPRVLAGFAILLVLGAAIAAFRKNRLVIFALSWAILATLPTSNLIVLINALFYDHWFILPSLSLFLALSFALKKAIESRAAFWPVGVFCLFPLLPLWNVTAMQNSVWREPIALFEHILSYEPRSVKIMNNLAMSLAERNGTSDQERARELYLRAISISDTYSQTHHNLGMIYLHDENIDLAEAEFKTAIRMNPQLFQAHAKLGEAYLRQGRINEAVAEFKASNEIFPNSLAERGLAEAALKSKAILIPAD